MGYRIRKLEIKTRKQGMDEFAKIGSTLPGQKIMIGKLFPVAFKIKDVDIRAANILKQEMLARMGDVVTSRETLMNSGGLTDVIILGTKKGVISLIDKIRIQPFGLKKLSEELSGYLDYIGGKISVKMFRVAEKSFDLGIEGALIMGILNVTPDSFYDGGLYSSAAEMQKRADKIVSEGAHIIDVGGLSTRPGSKPVAADEELERIIPAIKYIKAKHDILISVDTYRAEVAEKAIREGAVIVNDISGHTFDSKMAGVVAHYGVWTVIMHIKGTPVNMQINPVYGDVIDEIYDFLYDRTVAAIEAGIGRDKIIIDPGLGFGKNLEHNLRIISGLSDFTNMGYPVMVGASRKSFIGALLDAESPVKRLEGSLSAAVCAFINGASILRVHDVKKTREAIKIAAGIYHI
ncbi:MAG: dihydropteroate synthase [Actinobacteria bacterium]|nr:dihydropteroate synthase [Actinomycetota bacterium]